MRWFRSSEQAKKNPSPIRLSLRAGSKSSQRSARSRTLGGGKTRRADAKQKLERRYNYGVVEPSARAVGTRIASLIPCKSFLSAGTIVANAPRI